MKNKAYIPGALLILLGLTMHIFGSVYHLYLSFTWYDDPVHFVSGLGSGLVFYWILSRLGIVPGGIRGKDLWAIVGCTFICAVAWECFEARYDFAGYPVGSIAYFIDTAKDITNGTVGSIAAVIVISRTYEKSYKLQASSHKKGDVTT